MSDPIAFAQWRHRLQAVTNAHHLVQRTGAVVQWSPLVRDDEAVGVRAAFSLGPDSPTAVHDIEFSNLDTIVIQGALAEDASFTRAVDPLITETLVVGFASVLEGTLAAIAQARARVEPPGLSRAQRRLIQ